MNDLFGCLRPGSAPAGSIAVPAEVARSGPILVTGAGGFLGANVVWALREHRLPVRALVHRRPPRLWWQGLNDVDVVVGDVCNPAVVARAVTGVNSVIHCAGLTQLVPRPRRRAFRVNVESTRTVCAAAVRAGVRRLVFTSSLGTVSPGSVAAPATEQTPFRPDPRRAPYHVSKRLAEQVIAEYAAAGLETITFCPAFIIGPRNIRPTTNQLILYLARFPLVPLPPGGINFIDVRVAALAHVRSLWLGQPGGRYLLAGPYLAYAELGAVVLRLLGSGRALPRLPPWTYLPGSVLLSLLSGVLPQVPNALTVPNFQYGFVPFHVSGALADQTFHLVHRPVRVTVWETLRWFQETGLAPWLTRPLVRPEEAVQQADASGL